MKKLLIPMLCVLFGIAQTQCTLDKKSPAEGNLARNFVSPPDEARPWVFWFWLNGNITRGGITADLEAMKRAGIGGVLIMEVDQGAPVGPVAFMSDQWRELFKFMITEANRLGIEVDMNNDAGWNGSGGPWVPLDKAMQVIVTSEKQIPAGASFKGILPKPPANEGFYRDIAVLAFPSPTDTAQQTSAIRNLPEKGMFWGTEVEGRAKPAPVSDMPVKSFISRDRIIDLSAMMDTNGKLSWDAPSLQASESGRWTVVRIGHTFTGRKNHPAPATGIGPECDKLSKEGVEANYNGMIGKLAKDIGAMTGKTFNVTHVDSWEVGAQNWTAKMREEFKRLRGYDMITYLPVFTGRIIENPDITERFLRDIRQTVSDLIAENYIGHLRELANKDGLRLSMEAYTTPANDLDVANHVEDPIAEFWWPGGSFWWSIKAMASVAHVNGRPIVGAESFTADDGERWQAHPANIKALGDRAFCDGINRYIVHRYAMQPWVEDRRPGMTMGPWGLHYERTQTWWEDSKAWHLYVARCQYLLRQGTFVADALSLQPEEPMQRFKPLTLNGYDYDGISPQAFLKDVSVRDGIIELPSGMKYRLLVLPDVEEMTPEMLQKITNLVENGANVVGKPPIKAPGLSNYPASDSEVKKLAGSLWGTGSEMERKVGNGRVFTGKSPSEVLAAIGVQPDFMSSKPINFIHRSMKGNEVYFIASADMQSVDAVCSFRITGMKPEAWYPETGRMEPITVFEDSDGCTKIPLRFEPSGSMFIVFKTEKVKDSDRIVSVKCDGKELAGMDITRDLSEPVVKSADAKNTFTMAGWIHPDIGISLPPETAAGVDALSVERNDAVYAAPGHEVWSDKDAGAGFGAGTNGIIVCEHSSSYFPAILVFATPISGWTHVAVVYKDNTPSLWINGKHVHKGLKSNKIVHGSIGVAHTRSLKPFSGRVTGLAQFPTALSSEDLMKLAQSVPDTTEVRVPEPSYNMLKQEIANNGTYQFKTADGKTREMAITHLPDRLLLKGPWDLSFTPGWGAPEKIVMDNLISWSKHPDDGVKHFSGSATYRKTFSFAPLKMADPLLKPVFYLDLGKVEVIAEVKLNDKDMGVLWKPPYRVDISEAVIAGENVLEVRVVNLIINRMIGDESLPQDCERNENGTLKRWPQWLLDGKPSPTGRFTFTSWRLWDKGSRLQESGLLGPVTIITKIHAL
jgi:hypothetical protein